MFDALSNFFEFLNNLGNGQTSIIFVCVVVVLCIVGGIFFLYHKYKGKIDSWSAEHSSEAEFLEKGRKEVYDKKISIIEKDIDMMKKDIAETKESIKTNRDNLTEMSNNLNNLIEKFDSYIECDRKRTVVSLRNSIWQLHKEFTANGEVTVDELKNFNAMVEEYEQAGGNDIVHSKLKPEVLALRVKYVHVAQTQEED